MNRMLKPGIILGLIVVVWQFAYGALGLYKEPSTGWIFTVLAILIQIGVLVWGLMQSAKDGKSYWGQVGVGVMISLFAGILIVIGSYIFTSVAFPDVFEYMADQQADAFAARGVPEDQIDQQLQAMAFTRTPAFNAIMGFIGTMVSGFVISLIAGAFLRKKD